MSKKGADFWFRKVTTKAFSGAGVGLLESRQQNLHFQANSPEMFISAVRLDAVQVKGTVAEVKSVAGRARFCVEQFYGDRRK